MKTFKIEGWLDGALMVEECGVESSGVSYLISELEEEGYTVRLYQE